MRKEVTTNDLAELIDTLAISMAKGFDDIRSEMATKKDLIKTELNLQTQINSIEIDLRSFKQETNKNFIMKQYLSIQMTKGETIAFILLLTWIIASCFVPLPEVNSLGQ